MAFESVNYQCPACGGPLHFASAEQKLVCDYCDSRFEVEEVEALYRERQDKADAKADAAAATPKPVADDAVNYGAIGVVIGHEMTHGFDDQGRNFDKDGNMNNWWTEEDAAAFKAKTDILVKQFDAIEVLPAKGDQPALFANGALCLGENIADQGGLRVAYTAYHNSLEGKEKPAPIDGFTPEQRFYLAYAQLWAQNIRDEEIARLTKLDVHSLGKWRVDATLRNLQDFYDAFSITDGAMYMPVEERVIIW